jgi:hypothetical protein
MPAAAGVISTTAAIVIPTRLKIPMLRFIVMLRSSLMLDRDLL